MEVPLRTSRRESVAAPDPRTRTRLHSFVLLAAVLVLFALVMLTAGSGIVSVGSSAIAVPRELGSVFYASFTALLVVAFAVGLLIVYALRPSRRRKRGDEPEWVVVRPPLSWVDRVLAVLVPVLLIAAIAVIVALMIHSTRGAGSSNLVVTAPPAGAATTAPHATTTPPSGTVQPPWGILGFVAGGLLVAGAAAAFLILRSKRSRPGPTPGGADLDVVVGRAAELSLEDLRRERDPRRAILAAYARMEGLFAGAGLLRRRTDTPSEYLADILHASSAPPGALLDLTLLFEEARFSSHEMSTNDRDEAISALAQISGALT